MSINVKKFILKHYDRKTTRKNILCDCCENMILKGSVYLKHSGNQFHRLCNLCFINLSLDSIKSNIDNIKAKT